MGISLDVKYESGHSYNEIWEEGSLFCPGCGKRGVWEEQTDGDYYVGPSFLCPSCGATFTIQYSGITNDWQDEQRLAAILARIKEAD